MRRIRAGLLVAAAVGLTASLSSRPFAGAETSQNAARIQGLAAWEQVYAVLTSPRCINCHPATDYPQQGDDRHRHVANVVRGPEGKGVPVNLDEALHASARMRRARLTCQSGSRGRCHAHLEE